MLREELLDGTQSYDPDNDPISDFTWVLVSQPSGSRAEIRDALSARAYLTPDRAGLYVVGLIVSDGKVPSERATMRLTASDECCKPIASAGSDVSVPIDGEVTLDGTGSTDPRAQPLRFAWRVVGAPEGTQPFLSDPAAPSPLFRPDRAWPHVQYELELVVANRELESEPDRVVVRVRNSPPTVSLGPNQRISTGATSVRIEAAGADADRDPLTYRWSLIAQPGTRAELQVVGASGREVLLVPEPNQVGDYVVEVVANDGYEDSPPARVVLSATNAPPAVSVGADVSIGHVCAATGACTAGATLAGEATDAEGDAVSVEWRVKSRAVPTVAVALETPTSLETRATFAAADGRIAGVYEIEFCARDALHDFDCRTGKVTVTNRPPAAQPVGPVTGHHTAAPLAGGGVRYEAVVELSGLGTDEDFEGSDPTGERLTYLWYAGAPTEMADPATEIRLSSAASKRTAVILRKDCPPGACASGPGFLGDYTLYLEAKDANGAAGTAPARVTVANRPPAFTIQPASADVSPGGTVQLNAVGADPDGDEVTFSWRITQGTGGRLLGPQGEETTRALETASGGAQVYEVELTATDVFGASAVATARVVTNLAPVIHDPFPSTITTGHTCNALGVCSKTVALSASASDPEADALSYEWKLVSRPLNRLDVSAELTGSPASGDWAVTLTSAPDGAISGAYEIDFCASDALHTVCRRMTLSITNSAPSNVSAGSNFTAAHTAVPSGSTTYRSSFQLAGTAQDADYVGVAPSDLYGRLRWSWSNPNPSEVTLDDPTSRTPSVTVVKSCASGCGTGTSRVGPYTFNLTVTDGNGDSATAAVTVTIGNTEPVVALQAPNNVAQRDVLDGAQVALVASGTDADEDALFYAWSIAYPPGASGPPSGSGSSFTLATTPGIYGSYTVTVTVSDGFATSAPASVTLRANKPPVVAPSLSATTAGHACTASGACCTAGGGCDASQASLTASANATDLEGDALTYAWTRRASPNGGTGPGTVIWGTPGQATTTVAISAPSGNIAGTYVLEVCAWDALHPSPAGTQCGTVTLTVTNARPTAYASAAASVAHGYDPGVNAYFADISLTGYGTDPEHQGGATPPSDSYFRYAWAIAQKPDPYAVISSNWNDTSPTTKNYSFRIVRYCNGGVPLGAPPCPAPPFPGEGQPGGVFIGSYVFTLTVTDPSGFSSDPAGVTVRVTNAAPAAFPDLFAGDNTSLPGHAYAGGASPYRTESFQFSGAPHGTTDPEGDPLRYVWYVAATDAAPPCPSAAASGVTVVDPSVGPLGSLVLQGGSVLVNATHSVCLQALDPWGLTACDCAQVTVGNRLPAAPLLGFGNDPPSVNTYDHEYSNGVYRLSLAVDADGASVDADGDPVTYSWSAQTFSGVTVTYPNPPLAAGTLTLAASVPTNLVRPESHVVCLTATDSIGAGASSCRNIQVTNRAPRASQAGFGSGTYAHSYSSGLYRVEISPITPGAYVDDDGDPRQSWSWVVPGSSTVTATGPSPGSTGTVRLESAVVGDFVGRSHSVCLETKDVFGAASPQDFTGAGNCRTVTVSNSAPTVTLSQSRTGSCGCYQVTLTATVADNTDGDPVTVGFSQTSQAGCTVQAPAPCSISGTGSCQRTVEVSCTNTGTGAVNWTATATDTPGASGQGTAQTGTSCAAGACGGGCGC